VTVNEVPLRVAFLADCVAGGGGMGRYTREVLRALARREDIELFVLFPRGASSTVAELIGTRRGIRQATIRGRTRVGQGLWERYRLGSVVEAWGDDVVIHGMKHLVPKTRLPTVLTVHDLLPLTSPEQFNAAKRVLLPRQYRASLRDATVLAAASAATRDRLIAVDPRAAEKTFVVSNAFTRRLTEVSAVPIPELSTRPFALLVGDLSPRKNAQFLLELWPEVFERTRGTILAVVGPDGWRSRATRRKLAAIVDAGLAVRPGRVDDGELRWCYENAQVVVVPTLEEGFGLPVLEAQAFGTPVVANPERALVEVGGETTTFVSLDHRAGWVEAIARATGVSRQSRVEGPLLPTWDDHAAGLVKLYERARNNVRARSAVSTWSAARLQRDEQHASRRPR
jgi:glycosyltransferase involved in cell wall biosynthesis